MSWRGVGIANIAVATVTHRTPADPTFHACRPAGPMRAANGARSSAVTAGTMSKFVPVQVSVGVATPSTTAWCDRPAKQTTGRTGVAMAEEGKVTETDAPWPAGLRVALVHDWLTGMRGGEKCLEVFYEIGIRIPIVTALTEELLFRSVLLAVFMAIISTRWAVAWSSVVFGLWHVLTTLNDLDGNAATDALSAIEQAASVVAVVFVTLLGGVVFAVARLRSGSIVAP